ncbi:hypothetical protein [Halorussus lipolyticus]|uniref:hypothetical protein n=1 Tax=Halorussus lipolyticus TaxID=3034024 RepID=UPI0023E8CB50|nr:hypothetical protein [Halorussus sp. DT80]
MSEDTQNLDADEQSEDPPEGAELRTSGHIERTILHHMAGDGSEGYAPTTVSGVLDDIAAVIERGDYANVGPKGSAGATVRKSTVRRTFTQLHEKGLVQRVEELSEDALGDPRFDLGACKGDPDDPTAYERVSDDARVTDWILTDDGRREVERLDARYADELDELAARYGRKRGETTARVDG